MDNSAYADAGVDRGPFGWKRRAERKPWSILEMGAVVGGFMVFWPLGLAALYLKHRNGEIWTGASDMQGPWTQWKTPQDTADHMKRTCGSWGNSWGSKWANKNWQGFAGFTPTGNDAFDEYRRSKLDELEAMRRKLDEERAAFDEFLAKLRKAKDREDFERFMNERTAPKTEQ